jgi:hypothetical protein
MLYKDKEKIIPLYSALTGKPCDPDTEIEIVTLSDALYMNMYNDLAFIANGELIILVEHQSTLNMNMPLRDLMYVAREYEKVLSNENFYRTNLIKIPKPEFVVLYNGERSLKNGAEEQILKLSDAFIGINAGDEPNLELIVKVIDINFDPSKTILQKDATLNGYSYFVDLARKYQKNGLDQSESFERAIKDCISQGILTEFFEANGSEVVNMLLGEWDMKIAEKVWKEEAREEGWAEGKSKGKAEGEWLKALKDARKMLAKGFSLDSIQEITELDLQTIKGLRKEADNRRTDISAQ